MFEQMAIYSVMDAWERALLLFPLGAVIGSFSSVILLRRSQSLSLWTPRSRCPACGHTLGPAELIPLASFLWQRGRCTSCRTQIPWRYPLLELGSGLLAAGAGAAWGWAAGFAVMALWVGAAEFLARRSKRRVFRDEAGVTLVEVLVSVMLMSVVVIGMLDFGSLIRGGTAFQREIAATLASKRLETLENSIYYATPGTTPPGSGVAPGTVVGPYTFNESWWVEPYTPSPSDGISYADRLWRASVKVQCVKGCSRTMQPVRMVGIIARVSLP